MVNSIDRGSEGDAADGAPPAAGGSNGQSSYLALRRVSAMSLARATPWLAAQPASFGDALLAAARLRDFAAGATIIGAESEAGELHFLVRGCVQVTVPRPNQELSLTHLHLPGEWFGEASSVGHQRSPAEYRTRGRCVTLSVPRTELALLRRSNQGAAAMLELLASAACRLTEVLADAAGLDPPRRVISKLLSLTARGAGDADADACALPVTQFELAELCSVSRTTVAKVVGELAARQVVACSYAEIRIRSRRSLEAALRERGHDQE